MHFKSQAPYPAAARPRLDEINRRVAFPHTVRVSELLAHRVTDSTFISRALHDLIGQERIRNFSLIRPKNPCTIISHPSNTCCKEFNRYEQTASTTFGEATQGPDTLHSNSPRDLVSTLVSFPSPPCFRNARLGTLFISSYCAAQFASY